MATSMARQFACPLVLARFFTGETTIFAWNLIPEARLIWTSAGGSEFRQLDTSRQVRIPEWQEVRGVHRAGVVEIERRVVWRNSQKHVPETQKIRGIGVAVAVEVSEESKDIGGRVRRGGGGEDKIIAAGAVAIAV